MFLRELKNPITQISGVGPKTAEVLRGMGISSVADLLLHLPRDYEDRRNPVRLKAWAEGRPVNTVVRVVAHHYIGRGRNRTLKVVVEEVEANGERAALLCFGRNFLSRTLAVGSVFFLFGQFQHRFGEIQSSSFEVEPWTEEAGRNLKVLPVYPLTAGINQGSMRRIVKNAVQTFALHLEDEVPQEISARHALLPKSHALKTIHFPESVEEAERALRSLSFEELFFFQLTVGRRALRRKSQTRKKREGSERLQRMLLERLPFVLTPDQTTCLEEMSSDLSSDRPMSRLLQGEVGSGKTLVALLVALLAIESGRQVAFMAPTELLARQHAENTARLLSPLGIRLAFLSGNVRDPNRGELLRALAAGEIDLIIGTHALFTWSVEFADLGLVIVDEQHRFGVLQRAALTKKGDDPDLLLMTATPIPRTLAMTAFGDLDISTIRTMPKGRRPIVTHLARIGNEAKVYEWVRKELSLGHQSYFVYPLIEQSEFSDLKDAESMYEELRKQIFPNHRLGLIHSRIPEEQKVETMEAFVRGEINILVATSVVEVGVDVPNATVIVIEHADRFGLSALHQLRGRVGRSDRQSYAFLIYGDRPTDVGKQRLKAMMETTDGFRIAEQDLALRGPGEISGTRQSGYYRLAVADLGRDFELLKTARQEAFDLLEADPGFLLPANQVVREVVSRTHPFEDAPLSGG
ncbi:MAG TPA: ATP-dependent DNA helicase RecG [Spirochaetia bacterium]|nr:ATP-dependent DNA helicase RecG [Spirochaetia bacterium]